MSWTRSCASCGKITEYKTQLGYQKAQRLNRLCRTCALANSASAVDREAVIELYRKELFSKDIAAILGCHYTTVQTILKREGLKPIRPKGQPPEPVDEDHSRCRQCGDVVLNTEFPLIKSHLDGRRLSVCRKCRKGQLREALGANPEAFFADKENRLRRPTSGRKSRSSIISSLPNGYLYGLWMYQRRRCFYTREDMTLAIGAGSLPTAASVDRVDPTKGYEVGNVVLCRNRINSIKSDVSLEELAAWMPSWHERVANDLPDLIANVKPVDDGRARTVDGRRLPTWVIEHRRRLQEILEVHKSSNKDDS